MDKDKPVSLFPDRPFDKLRLTDLKSKSIDPKQYERKTIFLNFWATWCKPCIAEMPSIQKAQELLKDKEVVFLLASSESIEEISSFREAHNYKFSFTRVENSEEMNIQGLPTTFIFDPTGQLDFAEMGSRKWDDKSNIDMILKIGNIK